MLPVQIKCVMRMHLFGEDEYVMMVFLGYCGGAGTLANTTVLWLLSISQQTNSMILTFPSQPKIRNLKSQSLRERLDASLNITRLSKRQLSLLFLSRL